MNKVCYGRAGLIASILCLFLYSGLALAKLVPVNLAGLIEESDVIAYGRPVAGEQGMPPQASAAVRFQPLSVLKGKSLVKGKIMAVCNDPSDSESYDLRQLAEPYVVFVMRGKDCFMPVHGMFSIVPVSDGTAATWRIQGEPEKQALNVFLKKIISQAGKSSARPQSH